MNGLVCRIAFCVLYSFYKFAPAAFTADYLRHLTHRGLIPPSDYPDSGAAHMEDYLSSIGAIMAVVVIAPLFLMLTAGCRRFRFRFLPSRRLFLGFGFRALVAIWLYSIIASEAVFYVRGGYFPLIASTAAGIIAVLILYIGVDSAHFQSAVSSSNLQLHATENA